MEIPHRTEDLRSTRSRMLVDPQEVDRLLRQAKEMRAEAVARFFASVFQGLGRRSRGSQEHRSDQPIRDRSVGPDGLERFA